MPLSFTQIIEDAAETEFAYRGGNIHLTYYPGRITEKTLAKLNSFYTMTPDTIDESFATFNETLCSLIKAWDLFEDDEQTVMYPLDPDRFGELPIPFRKATLEAIMESMRPNETAPQTRN